MHIHKPKQTHTLTTMSFSIEKYNLTLDQIEEELERLVAFEQDLIKDMKATAKNFSLPQEFRQMDITQKTRYLNNLQMKIKVYRTERTKRINGK